MKRFQSPYVRIARLRKQAQDLAELAAARAIAEHRALETQIVELDRERERLLAEMHALLRSPGGTLSLPSASRLHEQMLVRRQELEHKLRQARARRDAAMDELSRARADYRLIETVLRRSRDAHRSEQIRREEITLSEQAQHALGRESLG